VTGDAGLIGEVTKVSAGTPPVVVMVKAHGLENEALIRIRNGASRVTCYARPDPQAPCQFTAWQYANKQQPADLPGVGAGAVVERLNSEDWAVVAGINYYPAFTDLMGPRVDSTLFKEWLVNAGFVPEGQVLCIQSPPARPVGVADARPTQATINDAFLLLIRQANGKKFHRLGRRLYVFLSGHGIIATRTQTPDWREAALLAADADSLSLGKHVCARSWAEWFRALAIFDEVFLFADCCRDQEDLVPPAPIVVPPWKLERTSEGRHFYAFSTKLGSKSWEMPLGAPPNVRGAMSFVVNEALKNPKLYDKEGLLTASALGDHIYSAVPKFSQKQNPVVDYDKNPTLPELVIAKWIPRTMQTIQIDFNPEIPGGMADLFAGSNTNKPLGSHAMDGQPWIQQLDAGCLYKVTIRGTDRRTLFETNAIDEVQIVTV